MVVDGDNSVGELWSYQQQGQTVRMLCRSMEGSNALSESEITRYARRCLRSTHGGHRRLAAGHALAHLSARGRGGRGADPDRRTEGRRPPPAGARARDAAGGQPPGRPRGHAHAGGPGRAPGRRGRTGLGDGRHRPAQRGADPPAAPAPGAVELPDVGRRRGPRDAGAPQRRARRAARHTGGAGPDAGGAGPHGRLRAAHGGVQRARHRVPRVPRGRGRQPARRRHDPRDPRCRARRAAGGVPRPRRLAGDGGPAARRAPGDLRRGGGGRSGGGGGRRRTAHPRLLAG